MPKFVIERELPGPGSLSTDELRAISRKSNEVLASLALGVQWQHSYVTANKIYCVHVAENEKAVRSGQRRGFPANAVNRVVAIIDPTTAEA